MFTGLIQDMGEIESLQHRGGGISLTISTQLDLRSVKVGDSISVEGVCLTVVRVSGRAFSVEISPETLGRTTLAFLKKGQSVNLETALKISDLLGGHLVSGHVDGTGEIAGVVREGNSWRYHFCVPPEVSRYVIEKGSIAVDGISLTVAECGDQGFSVSVIPHTAERTTLGKKKAGDRVNLENDLIAKYVEKFVRQAGQTVSPSTRINAAFLAEHGFEKS